MPVDPSPFTHDGLPVAQLLTDLENAAYNSLAQTPAGLPAVHGVFWDQPPEDCCDALQLWVREWIPVKLGDFPNALTATELCSPIDMDPTVVLSLRRPCAPEPDSSGYVNPADEVAMAQSLVVDSRALFCGVLSQWNGILAGYYESARIFYGTAQTSGATSSCMGIHWSLQIELRGCRGAGCLDVP